MKNIINKIKVAFCGAKWCENAFTVICITPFVIGALAPVIFIYDLAIDFIFPPGKETTIGGFTVYINEKNKIVRIPYFGRQNVFGIFNGTNFLVGVGNEKYAALIYSAAQGKKLSPYANSSKIIAKFDCKSWQVRPIEKKLYPGYFCRGEPVNDHIPDRYLRWFSPSANSGWNDALAAACYAK